MLLVFGENRTSFYRILLGLQNFNMIALQHRLVPDVGMVSRYSVISNIDGAGPSNGSSQ